MQVVKVKAPTSVVNGGGINYNRWLDILRKIKSSKFRTDCEATRSWIRSLESGFNVKERPQIDFKAYDELVISSGVFTDVRLPNDRQTLLSLNSEVREVIKQFEKDAEILEDANAIIQVALKKVGESKQRADELTAALNFLKRVSHVHHGLMAVPLMTHAALSRAAASLRK